MRDGKGGRKDSAGGGPEALGSARLADILKGLASKGMSRRDFMRLTAGTGLMLGVGNIFQGCGGSSTGAKHEQRTYFFDLSHAAADREYHVAAGRNRYKLLRTDESILGSLRSDNGSLFSDVPDSRITHYIDGALFSNESHQLCYVKSVHPGSTQWRIEAVFLHIPQEFEEALLAHQQKSASFAGSLWSRLYGEAPGACGAAGAARSAADATDYCAKYNAQYKTYFDTAKSLIFHHPDVMSMDPATATYVLNNVVCAMPQTLDLAVSIYRQLQNGGSWAVQTPIIDDATGEPYKNSEGHDQYSITWTEETNKYVGRAVLAITRALKNDMNLGANVTDRTSAGAGPVSNDDLKGKLWLMRDGVASVNQATVSARNARRLLEKKAAAAGFSYTFANQSTERGFNIPSFSVDPSTRQISIEAHNWYVRYLGLYVRYLDANGKALRVPDDIRSSMSGWQRDHSGTYDALWGIIEPEMAVLGVPVKDFDHTFSFPVPEAASTVMIIAGGLGAGHTDYPDAVGIGACATTIVNLAIPTLFLISAAASAYSSFAADFQGDAQTIGLIAFAFAAVMDEVIYGETGDSGVFMNLAGALAGILLKKLLQKGLEWLARKLYIYLAEGEVIDSIPFIGWILCAIAAAGTAAQIGETAAEVARSPKTFDYRMVFTHDVTVSVAHDPADTGGFPAVAASYEIIALLDGATTRRSGRLPLGSRGPLAPYTFTGLPYGGNVKFSVGFFAENGWVAGQGQTEVMDNTTASVSITIKENKVPLEPYTFYWHLQKTVADSSGRITWSGSHQAPATAPAAKADSLRCSNVAGNLCSVGGITASETYAAIGMTWQSASSGVSQCGGAGGGQLYQMRTLSLTVDPESSELNGGCGSRFPFRMAFSLMGTNNDNYYLDPSTGRYHVRQIRFTAPGQAGAFDQPGSNRSFGRLNLLSDGMLLHPLRKIISINRQMSIMEILDLPQQATADSGAPVAAMASGEGLREGLMAGPLCTGMTADGAILVLEAGNRRVQAFDTGANPVKQFGGGKAYYFALKAEPEDVRYLDMAVEYAGFIYILSYGAASRVYRLDIYRPDGSWLSRTLNVNAAALAIDFWRNVYTLNYETITAKGITSPSVSLWIPSVPQGSLAG